MKNVVVISSTPRKGGNSDALCDEFAKGAIADPGICEKGAIKGAKYMVAAYKLGKEVK